MCKRLVDLFQQYEKDRHQLTMNVRDSGWDYNHLHRVLQEPLYCRILMDLVEGDHPCCECFLELRDFMQRYNYALPALPEPLLFETDVDSLKKIISDYRSFLQNIQSSSIEKPPSIQHAQEA